VRPARLAGGIKNVEFGVTSRDGDLAFVECR
jgi:hypothetical protein